MSRMLLFAEAEDAGLEDHAGGFVRWSSGCMIVLVTVLGLLVSGLAGASEPMLKLLAPEGIEGNVFGGALAADGDFLAVGAPGHPSPLADPDTPALLPTKLHWSGQVYVFRFDPSADSEQCVAPEEAPCWTLFQSIPNPDPRVADCCGYPSSSCLTPRLDVPYDPTTGAPTIPNACQQVFPAFPGFPAGCDPNLPFTGPEGPGCVPAAPPTPARFEDNGEPGWNPGRGIFGSADRFGTSVAISGEVLIVGSPGDRGAGTTHSSSLQWGAAWVYRNVDVLDPDQYCAGDPAEVAYPQEAPTVPPPCFVLEQEFNAGAGRQPKELFGYAVAVQGAKVAVGMPLYVEDFKAGQEPSGIFPKTYLYEYNGVSWQGTQILEGSQNAVIQGVEYFGSALAASEDRLAIGAMGNNEKGLHVGESVSTIYPSFWENEEIATKDGLVWGERLCRQGAGCVVGDTVALSNPPLVAGTLSLFGLGLLLVEGVDYDNIDLAAGTFQLLTRQTKSAALEANYQGSERVDVEHPKIVPGTLEVYAAGTALVEGEGYTASPEELAAGEFDLLQPHASGTVTASYEGGQIVQLLYPPVAMKTNFGGCNAPRDLELYFQDESGGAKVPLVCGEDYLIDITATGTPIGNIEVLKQYPDGTIFADYVQGFGWGAMYLFDWDGNELQKIFPEQAGVNDLFGTSVSISEDGESVSAGALLRPYDWNPRTEVLERPEESGRGSAFVFVKDGSDWKQQAELRVEPLEAEAYLGAGVAFAGDGQVVVGAPADDVQVIDGGAVATFEKREPGPGQECADSSEAPPCWVLVSEQGPSDVQAYDQFGDAVAATESWAFFGAPQENVGPGAVYVRSIPEPGAIGLVAVLAALAGYRARLRRRD